MKKCPYKIKIDDFENILHDYLKVGLFHKYNSQMRNVVNESW